MPRPHQQILERPMKPLNTIDDSIFQSVRFVLTDMDETLTFRGRLAAQTYDALERLQSAGLRVIPVTAAPAGWCDQMARMWPVDGVIGENGGFFFHRNNQRDDLTRIFWHPVEHQETIARRLAEIGAQVRRIIPAATFAEDQPFRLTSLAFSQPEDPGLRAAIIAALREADADVTVNNLWVLGWLGGYDKLAMARRVLAANYGVDIDSDRNAVLYVGDSTNDAPMFGFFNHTVGVSTVRHYLPDIPTPPNWITEGPGGWGFVEAADAVISSRIVRSARPD
jgi:HAD superfamily hydrolase (TIGR01484 family)